jgi:acyl-CoA reductase-like NAD-dependent aldehyde dehydrogenase
VEAAQAGLEKWAGCSAYLKSQILYRWAEMVESQKQEFVSTLVSTQELSAGQCENQISQAIDRIVHYAGLVDKFPQLTSTINPVAGSFGSYSIPESQGVTVLVYAPERFQLAELIELMMAPLVAGNSLIVVLDKSQAACPALVAPLAESLNNSDLPAGVINILTADAAELMEWIAGHGEIRAVRIQSAVSGFQETAQKMASENMKRVLGQVDFRVGSSLERVREHAEIKTIWHPIGF